MRLSKLFYGTEILIVFIFLALYFLHPIGIDITNGDLGRHLLLGKIISTSKHVPLTNLLSYTNTSFPFVNTHWLSEVFFYLCQKTFGFNGLIILSVLIITTAFSFIFLAASKKGSLFAVLLSSLLYIQVLSERTEVRPELFSFLFLSLFIAILYRYKKKYTNWIFTLIPIEFLWVNSHIYFFVGIAVLVLFLIDALITYRDGIRSKKFLTLFGVTIASCLVTIINPNFIRGAFYPLFVLNNTGFPVQEDSNFISAVTLYNDPTFVYFGVSVGMLWLCILLAMKKMSLVDVFLSAFFTFMGIFAVRDFPLFVFGTFIPLVKGVSYLKTTLIQRVQLSKEGIFLLELGILIVVCIVIFPIMSFTINAHGLGFGIIDHTKGAVQFLKQNTIEGPIYNNFDIGSYLDYQLYPKEKVFVDGRIDGYPKEFFQNIYFPMQLSPDIFDKESKIYHFNVIFFDHTDLSNGVDQLLYQLARNSNWEMVYLNNEIVIFLRNIPSNQKVIQKYHIDENSFVASTLEKGDKNSVRNLANFFRSVSWPNLELAMDIQYLSFDPTNCVVLKNVVYLMQQSNNPLFSVYLNTYQQTCINL